MPAKRKIAANAQPDEKNNEDKTTKQKKAKDEELAGKKGKAEKKGKKGAGSKNEEIDDVEDQAAVDSDEKSLPEVSDEPKGKPKKTPADKEAPAKKGKKAKSTSVDVENVRVTRNQSKKTGAAK